MLMLNLNRNEYGAAGIISLLGQTSNARRSVEIIKAGQGQPQRQIPTDHQL